MLNQVIQFVALFLLMLVTGVFWGPWFSIHRSMKNFSEEEFIKLVKTMANNLAVPTRVLMPTCIVFLSASVYVYSQKDTFGFYLNIAACCMALIALLITIIVEVPIVSQIQQWTIAAIPADWRAVQGRWLKFHVIRMLAAMIGFACLVSSVLFLQ